MLFKKSICVASKFTPLKLNENVRRGVRSNAQANLAKSLIVETSIKNGDLICNALRFKITLLKLCECGNI